MPNELPPIVKQAERVLAEIEEAVTRFPKKYKYMYGADLRACAFNAALVAQQAWRYRTRRTEMIRKLIVTIDELKLRVQTGDSLHVFSSSRSFEHIARMVANFGQQAGGWYKEHHKGQSAPAVVPAQRAQTLSARTASIEANP